MLVWYEYNAFGGNLIWKMNVIIFIFDKKVLQYMWGCVLCIAHCLANVILPLQPSGPTETCVFTHPHTGPTQ
jgi:hypothetical protein